MAVSPSMSGNNNGSRNEHRTRYAAGLGELSGEPHTTRRGRGDGCGHIHQSLPQNKQRRSHGRLLATVPKVIQQ